MPAHVPSRDPIALRTEVRRAHSREHLELLMGDVAAELILLEVDLRRAERARIGGSGDRQRLRAAIAELRDLAGEVRGRLLDLG